MMQEVNGKMYHAVPSELCVAEDIACVFEAEIDESLGCPHFGQCTSRELRNSIVFFTPQRYAQYVAKRMTS